jgi:cysteine desulfurase family protein (TIGR01976 family)
VNVDDIRRAFPALARTHNGAQVAYFDAPGGTQVPQSVADAMADYLFAHNANTHWMYPTSEETDAIIFDARVAAADLLNASPEEIAFGANMTTLTFHLARTLARTWEAGDEVIVTELDHHANVAPWRALEVERGIIVRSVRMIPETAQLEYGDFARLASKRTKLIAVGGASNAVGTINDLSRIASFARDIGAMLFVDAVHLAPHELIDVRAIGCDFLACSAYKFYGPHAGLLFVRRELVDALPFPKLDPAPDAGPERIETGTQNHEGIAGIAAAIDFLASLGTGPSRRACLADAFALLHERGALLLRRMWDGLQSIRGVRVYGPHPSQPRTPTIAFTIDGMHPDTISRRLAGSALFASSGDFYAPTCVTRLGCPEGVLRAGCACYTTEEEVERLITAVARLCK